MTSLGYVIFYVADVPRTAAFWRDAFDLEIRFAHDSGDYTELATGATTLAFVGDRLMAHQGITYRANRPGGEPAGAQISLTTATPARLYERAVARGARAHKPVETKPWGQESGFVLDENGILVEICTPVEHR
jgi:lactoylglutathione lyase